MMRGFINRFLMVVGCIAVQAMVPDVVRADPAWNSGAYFANAHGCVDCHGWSGISRSPDVPNLAGQKRQYLIQQMQSFRRGEPVYIGGEKVVNRQHPVMAEFVAALTDKRIFALADYYSRKACVSAPAERRVKRPAGAAQCETCHGGSRTNPFPQIPKLASQKARYLARQMANITNTLNGVGSADGRYHRAMEVGGHDLSYEKIVAYARYFAGLPCRKY